MITILGDSTTEEKIEILREKYLETRDGCEKFIRKIESLKSRKIELRSQQKNLADQLQIAEQERREALSEFSLNENKQADYREAKKKVEQINLEKADISALEEEIEKQIHNYDQERIKVDEKLAAAERNFFRAVSDILKEDLSSSDGGKFHDKVEEAFFVTMGLGGHGHGTYAKFLEEIFPLRVEPGKICKKSEKVREKFLP